MKVPGRWEFPPQIAPASNFSLAYKENFPKRQFDICEKV